MHAALFLHMPILCPWQALELHLLQTVFPFVILGVFLLPLLELLYGVAIVVFSLLLFDAQKWTISNIKGVLLLKISTFIGRLLLESLIDFSIYDLKTKLNLWVSIVDFKMKLRNSFEYSQKVCHHISYVSGMSAIFRKRSVKGPSLVA